MFFSHPWIILLCEPHVWLYDGRRWVDDYDQIRRCLQRGGGRKNTRIVVHEPATELLDCPLPQPQKLWDKIHYTREVSSVLWYKALARFKSTEGIAWMPLRRDALMSARIEGSKKSKGPSAPVITHLLGHMTPSSWLQEWLDTCAAHCKKIESIVPLSMILQQFAQTLEGVPREDLCLIVATMPDINLTLLLVTLDGQFVMARSWPANHQPVDRDVFLETIRYFDKFPRTREVPHHVIVLERHLSGKTVMEERPHLPDSENPNDAKIQNTSNNTATHQTFSVLRVGWVDQTPTSFLYTNASTGIESLSRTLLLYARSLGHARLPLCFRFSRYEAYGTLNYLMRWGYAVAAFAALSAGLYAWPLLQQTHLLQASIQKTQHKKQKLTQELEGLPPLSAEKIAFMTYATNIEKKDQEIRQQQEAIAPLSMVPRLSTALSETWRAYRVGWKRHGATHHPRVPTRSQRRPGQTLQVAVRYVGPREQKSMEIERQFLELRRNLESFFPSARVVVVSSPYEWKPGQPTNLRDLDKLPADQILTGTFDIIN